MAVERNKSPEVVENGMCVCVLTGIYSVDSILLLSSPIPKSSSFYKQFVYPSTPVCGFKVIVCEVVGSEIIELLSFQYKI